MLRGRRILRWTFLCCVVAFGVVACAGSDGSQPEVVSRTVDVEPEPESPSTTETTTTAEPTPTTEALTEDETAVLEVVRRFFEELPDRPDKTKTPDQYPDVLDEYITDPLLTRIRDGDAQDSAAGVTAESYPSLYFIDTIEISGTEARVTSCDLSRDATFAADGVLRTPSAGRFSISDLSLVFEADGAWRVAEWLIPTEDSGVCDAVLFWSNERGNPSDRVDLVDVGDQSQVDEVVRRLDDYFRIAGRFDERSQSRSDVEPYYTSVASRHELYFMSNFLQVQEEDVEADTVLAGWDYRIASVEVYDPTARLLVCAAPRLEFLSAEDGSLLSEDRTPIWSIAFMHRDNDGLWRVEYFYQSGETECAL